MCPPAGGFYEECFHEAPGLACLWLFSIVAVLPAIADEWSKTYNVSGNPDLRIETSDANIRVTTWDQNTIEAKVITSRYKIGEGGIRVEEHQTGNSVEIEVRYPHHNFNFEWGSTSGGHHRADAARRPSEPAHRRRQD